MSSENIFFCNIPMHKETTVIGNESPILTVDALTSKVHSYSQLPRHRPFYFSSFNLSSILSTIFISSRVLSSNGNFDPDSKIYAFLVIPLLSNQTNKVSREAILCNKAAALG